MRVSKIIDYLLISMLFFVVSLLSGSEANALSYGETYVVTVEKLKSNGIVTSEANGDSLEISTSAVAGSDGKISFSLTGVPDNSSCNFLIITVKDDLGNTARRSIAPCPNSGDALPLGVSGLTNSQTDALLEAAASAGIDDPVLVVFGLAIVRSEGITATELSLMANFANKGINGSGGFVEYLLNNGVTSSQLSTYRSNIITRFANTETGYTKLIKDSVDAGSSSVELDKRGEAASVLLKFLVQAASDTGFPQDRVIEAFNAMGAIVVPLMNAASNNNTLSNVTKQAINSSIGGGITKLRADRSIEKYSAALTTLNASSDDVTNYTTAAATLMNSMIATFKVMEHVFDGNETKSEIEAAQNTLNSAMNTAFNQFITDTAASDARITTMMAKMDTAAGGDANVSADRFKFYKSDGDQVNWPLTMVILTDYISDIIIANGSISYTRDDTSIPSSMSWLSARTTFGSGGLGIDSNYAALFGIQEDIMIIEFDRFGDQQTAGEDMSAQQTLEKKFSDALSALAGNISGTIDGSTSISSTQKSAIITLMQSPQF